MSLQKEWKKRNDDEEAGIKAVGRGQRDPESKSPHSQSSRRTVSEVSWTRQSKTKKQAKKTAMTQKRKKKKKIEISREECRKKKED